MNERHPSLQILDAMAARGVPRIRKGMNLDARRWAYLEAFPHSRGEKALLALAEAWANGHRPDIVPVLANVDRGYQAVVTQAAADLDRAGAL
jgi:hypothetical protein